MDGSKWIQVWDEGYFDGPTLESREEVEQFISELREVTERVWPRQRMDDSPLPTRGPNAQGYVNSDPRDEKANPPTKVAADGKTTLQRYRVDAVVYAPTLDEAHRRIKYDWRFDAASIERGET